jgi:hypothetical protein
VDLSVTMSEDWSTATFVGRLVGDMSAFTSAVLLVTVSAGPSGKW